MKRFQVDTFSEVALEGIQEVIGSEARRSGRTTRLLDFYLQQLFTHKPVPLLDHHPSSKAHEHLYRNFQRRLEVEHPWGSDKVLFTRKSLFYENGTKNVYIEALLPQHKIG